MNLSAAKREFFANKQAMALRDELISLGMCDPSFKSVARVVSSDGKVLLDRHERTPGRDINIPDVQFANVLPPNKRKPK